VLPKSSQNKELKSLDYRGWRAIISDRLW